MADEKSDDELLDACEAGDEHAFALLVDRYLPPVYSFAYRMLGNAEEAEDVAQETFLKAWKNLRRFKRGMNLKTWLFSIARNTAIDGLRKKRPALFSEFKTEDEETDFEHRIADTGVSAEERLDAVLDVERLDAALTNLSPLYRDVVLLRYHEGLTLEETAATLHIPLNTAKSRDRRAIIALRKLLGPPEGG
ncbi:MAG: sigma-70 family RNA polymerase sigma factor [Patescibacteria group bacterium]|nr:sigma-70 family RNA polymerase sigma factor [Patescibacteria group bacterium]